MTYSTSPSVLEDLTLEESFQFQEAQERLKTIIQETPLIYSPIFSKEAGNQVYIKPENQQTTGAFKIRGAYNKIAKLTHGERKRGLVASSAGNHAQGVAYAAQLLGVKATIVMPKATPLIKVEATRGYGANVVLAGDSYDDAYAEASKLQQKHNYVFIHPFDDLDVIEGQGTIGLEIIRELHNVDYILVPIGGGGLISGIAKGVKSINPNIKIIGVEPEGAKAMKLSLERNKLVYLDNVNTIADGVAVKRPGQLNYSLIKKYVDDVVVVSDYDIMDAFLLLLEKHKLIGENAGVLSLAGLKKLDVANKNIVCVISGGNIDVLTISSLINQGLQSRGRVFCFSVDLPDKPGELLKIAQVLAELRANVIKLDHNQFKAHDRFMKVQLEVTVETNGHKHISQITSRLEDFGYNIVKVY